MEDAWCGEKTAHWGVEPWHSGEEETGQGGDEAANKAMIEEDSFDPYEQEKVELCQEKKWCYIAQVVQCNVVFQFYEWSAPISTSCA